MLKQQWLVIEENQFTKETLKEYFKSSEIELYFISENQIEIALKNNTFKIVFISYQYMTTPTLMTYFKDLHLPIILYDAKEEKRLEAFKKQHVDKIFYGHIQYASLLNTAHQFIKNDKHKENRVLYFKDLELDVTKVVLKCHQQSIKINEKECSILELFISHPYQSFSLDKIRQQLFTENKYIDDVYIKSMIENIIHKLNQVTDTIYIANIWQIGYKMILE